MANNVGNTPLWFGYSLDSWDAIGSKLLVVAVLAGIFAAVASGLSSWISSAVTSRLENLAGDRITAAEVDLQKSRRETAAANERIAELGLTVAEANARASEANKIAESERLARVRLEAGLASRRLGSERASKLVASLISVRSGLPRINLMLLGDREAQEFGVEVVNAIQTAGVQVNVSVAGVMSPPPYGVIITDTPSGTLKAAFDAAGVPAQTGSATSAVPSILVGLKPPAF